MRGRLLGGMIVLLWVAGCVQSSEPGASTASEILFAPILGEGERFDEADPVVDPAAHATVTTGTPASLFPEVEWAVRPRKRMDLDQLEKAFLGVTGGIGWTQNGTDTGKNLFVEYSSTLGKPNFTTQTSEDLLPGVLFQKFLGDAARQACERLLLRDLASPMADRVLVGDLALDATVETDPAGVDANLSRLVMRFHSRDLVPGTTQLNPWRWLFESAAHVSGDAPTAWKTVCVGLFTHPDFYSY